MRRLGRRHRAYGVALVAVTLLAAACSRQQAPPQSPFGPNPTGAAPATSAPVATASPSATPTPTPTPTASATPTATATVTSGTPAAIDRELAIGQAIQQLAQWLGVEQASINLQSFETQDFPNSCLGVERPGIACASIVTPGARVVLRDALDQVHDVRMDASMRQFEWAPQHTERGTVTSVDLVAQTVTLNTAEGPLTLRRVPGTIQGAPLDALHAGDPLAVGYDGGPLKTGDRVLVWLERQ